MQSSKNILRKEMKLRRLAMTAEENSRRSRLLCRMVQGTQAYRQANTLFGYLPAPGEVDLKPLLHQALLDGKTVALPKCEGGQMRFIALTDLSRVHTGALGVPEPMADGPEVHDPRALVIVPGLVFDSRGYRLGYGGGYYDRFLSKEPEHPTIGLCFDFQCLPRLEPEEHDIPVDLVLSC